MNPISIVTKRMGIVGEQKIDHVTRIKPAMDAASSMLSLTEWVVECSLDVIFFKSNH